ncbi:hypothetical protein ACQKE5_03920 [Paenisporosarcina sp. NPDC076898]|uniref:hypothetical protein n=1 Tax=Paenisporosarcina sp. NPDC076898 TaxID=3390603 RepID=UPI003CFF55BB
MVVIREYSYQCECGWNGQWVSGGFRVQIPLLDKIEQQLLEAVHPTAKAAWRKLYRNILREELPCAHITSQSGFLVCRHCKHGYNQEDYYDSKTGDYLHPLICSHCGDSATILYRPQQIPCPACQALLEGKSEVSSDEFLKIILRTSKIQFIDHQSDELLILVGEKAKMNVVDSVSNLLIEQKEPLYAQEDGFALLQVLSKAKKVILHTNFDDPYESKLSFLLAKHIRSLNCEVVSIVTTPPIFEGRKRMESIMQQIMKLQSYSNRTILVSGSALERKFGTTIDLYNEHMPKQVSQEIQTVLESGFYSFNQDFT